MGKFLDDVVKNLLEGDVVSLSQHKTDKAFNNYASALGGIVQGERNFFATGKFMPFAKSYIESGFEPETRPQIFLNVSARDPRPSQEAKLLISELRKNGFKYEPPIKWAKGAYQGNPNQDPHGAWLHKEIDLNTAKKWFAQRDNLPFGAYQPSRSGMRTSHQNNWNDHGLGFNITVMGMDNRRGDKYGNPYRQEEHIIDDEKDMKEVSDMFAAIQRSNIKSVE
jgi:hypothetical protein